MKQVREPGAMSRAPQLVPSRLAANVATRAAGTARRTPAKSRLDIEFFAADTLEVARRILGCTLVFGDCSGVIVEVEAYAGDAASHHVTRPKTATIMGTTHGHVYVYSIYGMHLCLNFTTDARGPGAVLLRALEPRAGIDLMRSRRKVEPALDLCSGPAKLVQALGVERALTGRRVTDVFTLLPPDEPVAFVTGPRIGISEAMDLPWRFMVRGSRFLSRPEPRPEPRR